MRDVTSLLEFLVSGSLRERAAKLRCVATGAAARDAVGYYAPVPDRGV